MTDSPALPADLAAAGWKLGDDGKAIAKTFRFRGFRDAMAWMARAAFEAEHLNHHPEWSNVYNRVQIELSTHDVKGLSNLDVEMGQKINEMAGLRLKTAD